MIGLHLDLLKSRHFLCDTFYILGMQIWLISGGNMRTRKCRDSKKHSCLIWNEPHYMKFHKLRLAEGGDVSESHEELKRLNSGVC